ncbi:hypothetical protein Tco_0210914 [Tanacetum coccineum]
MIQNLLNQVNDKVDLEEFDLKSALFSHMNKKKSANKNTTNYHLYHALMEALIADEDAMDKEVAASWIKPGLGLQREGDLFYALLEHSEQSSDDIPMQNEGNDFDMEDTDNAHIPMDFPEPEHNWANAYASTFKVPEENKLQRKTYDIGSFIKWFCRRNRKKKLCKADLEGPAFNLVKAFHKNSVFLQYQWNDCISCPDK